MYKPDGEAKTWTRSELDCSLTSKPLPNLLKSRWVICLSCPSASILKYIYLSEMVEPYRSNQRATQAPSWSKDFMTLDWEMSDHQKMAPTCQIARPSKCKIQTLNLSISLIINKSGNFKLMPFGSSSLLQEHMQLTWTWDKGSLSQQRAKFDYSMRIPETVVHGSIIFNGAH